jgi:Mrp family chromosome partitioning ATPase
VFQSLPVDGVVIVSAPQTLVGMIVTKAVKMAEMMNIPVLGLVENYSYFQCPDCGKQHPIFGESTIDILAAQQNLPVLAKLPLDPALARAVDEGQVEQYPANPMTDVAALLDK